MENTSITFKGMSPQSLKRFIPELSDRAIKHISHTLDKELPYDILETVATSSDHIVHYKKSPRANYPMGTIAYSGPNSTVDKFTFLLKLIEGIKSSKSIQTSR